MSLAAPLALLALIGLPALWWLHRRARPAGDQPFSAFFLVAETAADGRAGRRLRAPLLLAARVLALCCLVVAAVGPSATSTRGTAVLLSGPVTPNPAWATPITWIRAGTPPTEVADPQQLAAVDQPAWGAAALLAQRLAPRATIVRAAGEGDAGEGDAPRVIGGGAAVVGPETVRVTAVTAGDVPPVLRGPGGLDVPLRATGGEWAWEGTAAPGGAQVDDWPICIPDGRAVKVADAGWPPAVERVLSILPGVERVPAAEADWIVGEGEGSATWAPFAPARTIFRFGVGLPNASPAPLWFADELPPPGAVARRWAALPSTGEPILFAGDRVVVDVTRSDKGRVVRFGFDPADTDLVETAGWPVLFDGLMRRTRRAAARCRVVASGTSVVLATIRPLTLRTPHGRSTRTLTPVNGRLTVDGLDARGLYRLESGAEVAWLAVQPPLVTAPPAPAPTINAPERAAPPIRWPWSAAAIALLVLSVVGSRRLRAPSAWLAPLVAALPWVVPPFGPPGAVVLAVDTSASVPGDALEAAYRPVREAFPDAPRVDGDRDVTGVGPGPFRRASAGTRHGPLLAAARELAGEGGVVVLFSDGRAEDGPVAVDVPVITVPVQGAAADARVESAQAVRLGDQVFVRAAMSADRAVDGVARLGPVEVALSLGPEARTVQAVLPADVDEIEVRVVVDGDAVPRNDAWPVAVADARPRGAVAVGAGAVGWLEAAGLSARELSAEGLAETGRQLGMLRAMAIHDQPAAAFSPTVLIGLMRWVASGGVLVLAGRDNAFGPGGWAGSVLDRLSPLAADPRPADARRLALVLALDRSGSMAEEAGGIGPDAVGTLAARIAAGLDDDDRLGVLAFGMTAEPLLAPAPVKQLRTDGIETPTLARGGTALLPMITAGVAQVGAADTARGVLMVVTDGQFTDPERADDAIRSLRRAGIRLVAVLTGEDPAVEPMTRIARASGGVAVRAEQRAISRRALAGVLMAAGDGLIGRGGPVQTRGAWSARVGGAPPPVGRRVRARLRDNARLLAAVDGEPLLAEWSIGQGRVIALATDRWALTAEQWAALLSPAAAPRPAEVTIHVDGDLLVYTADPREPPPADAAIIDDRVAVAWRAAGPGRAVAPLPPGPTAILTVTSATTRGAVVTRVTRPPPREVRQTGLDAPALALQAALTGGQRVAPEAVPQAVRAALGRRRTDPLTPWLLVLAAMLLVIEVARWAGLPMIRRRKSKRVPA